jgi:polyprenyl-phospho-N-acetylgalactosaminyl synthase
MDNGVFVVIPVYKEAPEVLVRTTKDVLQCFKNVIIVDDGTPNSNYEDFLSQVNVHYLRHRVNLGQGAALQTGTEYALRRGAKYIVHFDSDGQHNIDDVPKMINTLINDDVDIIIGSRFINKDDMKRIPKMRRYILKTATYVNWIFTGLKLTDAHNGLRVMNKIAAKKIRIIENRQAHASQIIHEIKREKLRFKEFPTTVYYTDYSIHKGQKNINVFNVFFDLILNSLFR